MITQMAYLNRISGGKSFSPPLDTIFESLEDFTSLDIFNLLHISCMMGRTQPDYRHKLVRHRV